MRQLPSDPDAFNDQVIERYRDHVNPALAQLMKFGGYGSTEWTGEGMYVTDVRGEQYLDALAGYGVFSLGHRHPRIVEAVRRQLDHLPLSTRQMFAAPVAALAERLAQVMPGDLQYSFFCHSGTESVEGALKCARIATHKPGVIYTTNAFHGKTMGSLSVGGRDVYRTPVEPLIPGFHKVEWGKADAVEAAMDEDTAAVIVEPVQGEGGINPAPEGYLEAIRAACDRRDALLIVDEVQTGFGRTGRMFAVEHAGVAPDLMCMAKALGGGVTSCAAFSGTPAVWHKVFDENPTIHTTSVSNLLAMAAGLETIAVIEDEGLAERAAEMGRRFLIGLRPVLEANRDLLADVRGLGLMVGLEFTEKDFGLLTITGLANRNIIAGYTLANPKVIRIEPPLIISEAEVDRIIEAVSESVQEAREIAAM